MSCGTPDSRPITLISLTGLLPSSAALSIALQLCVLLFLQVLYPECPKTLGLGSFHFARRYFENRCFFLFLRLLRCFSSPGSLRYTMYSCNGDGALPPPGFPIRISMDISLVCSSPWLFAAYHVLLRLLVPRHPPYALISLIVFLSFSLEYRLS